MNFAVSPQFIECSKVAIWKQKYIIFTFCDFCTDVDKTQKIGKSFKTLTLKFGIFLRVKQLCKTINWSTWEECLIAWCLFYKAHLHFWRNFLEIFSYEIHTILWSNLIDIALEQAWANLGSYLFLCCICNSVYLSTQIVCKFSVLIIYKKSNVCKMSVLNLSLHTFICV